MDEQASVSLKWQHCDRGRITVVATPSSGEAFTDRVDIVSSRGRGKYLDGVIARFPGLDRAELETQLDRVAAEVAAAQAARDGEGESPPSRDDLLAKADEVTDAALEAMDGDVIASARELLRDPLLIDRIVQDVGGVGIVGERPLGVLMYILGTSRQLAKPLAAIIQGASSSGKSYIPTKVATLFPPEAVFWATDITPNALYYAEPGALMHKWVVGGERRRGKADQNAEATRALREMLESGELHKVVPVKNPDGSGFVSLTIHQHGPIAFTESTTLTQIFDEDANRALLLSTDETPEQTRLVLAAQGAAAAGASVDNSRIRAVHHALQRMLKRVHAMIPFGPRIASAVPAARGEARRANKMVLNTVSAVAVLHQFQRLDREPRHGDVIQATVSDYAIARRILQGPMSRSLGGALPDAVVRFGARLVAAFGSDEFSSNEAAIELNVSKSKVNEYLAALAECGTTQCVEEGRGNKPARWKVVGDVPAGGADWLPRPEDIDPGYVERSEFVKSGAAGQQAGNAGNHAGNAAPTPSGSLGCSSGSTAVATPAAPKLPQGAGGSNFPTSSAESGLLPSDPAGPRVACNVPSHTRGWRFPGSTSQVVTCGLCHPPASPEPVEWVDVDDADGGGVVI